MSDIRETPCHTLELTIFRVDQTWMVELRHTRPQDEAGEKKELGAAGFDTAALLGKQLEHEAYGLTLAEQVFRDPKVKAFFLDVEKDAQRDDATLRLRVSIDPSAQELQALRWELLRHPESGAPLATSERVLFSRFMLSRDWRPIRLRARRELRALVAVSAPVGENFSGMKLAAVDGVGERSRAVAALEGIETRTLGTPEAPLTLEALMAALRAEVDILYLVAHGNFGRRTGVPALMLQDEQGDVAVVRAEELALRMAELTRGPRLVVLASCQSAGDGAPEDQGRPSPQATLAGRLADAGVPAVIAMQGNITMATVEAMMPVLFRELRRDGRIDRALAVARGVVRERDDHWMPALYSRLTDGRIWYTPGFRSADEQGIWEKLLPAVKKGKLVPILGPGLLDTACGDAFELARALAMESGFPLARHVWDDLPRVSQYLAVRESRYNVVERYKARLVAEIAEQHGDWLPPDALTAEPDLDGLLGRVADRLRETRPTDAHRLLAELGASIYVTTNYDDLLERALQGAKRTPRSACSRWRPGSPSPAPPFDPPIGESSAAAPLVYHAFGAFDEEDSLVLTEDDYFDFLIGTTADRLVPQPVEDALVDNALLFLGFRLTDWRFRVLFRLMRNLPGRKRMERGRYCHVAVQMDPELQTMADVEGAKAYLRKYFYDEARIEIFFGSAEEFLASLRDALKDEQARARAAAAPTAKKEDLSDEF